MLPYIQRHDLSDCLNAKYADNDPYTASTSDFTAYYLRMSHPSRQPYLVSGGGLTDGPAARVNGATAPLYATSPVLLGVRYAACASVWGVPPPPPSKSSIPRFA